ncbi:hypothetical protein MUK42_28440 [Musa troglodytarum]|uniref:WEB family protein n=1 Tax=Musa troglodytarum TaxID=320322 RepID=A0A9E7F4E2_9LILI|nr:hypothetical protein MUK42_28440 [Musa troglodytarum]
MEGQLSSPPPSVIVSDRAEVDTSRPFRSVKEAVAVFGDRFLAGNGSSQKNTRSRPVTSVPPPKQPSSASSSPPSYSSSASHFVQEKEEELVILSSLRKLEAELKEAKRELALLKGRESETEVAVASLSAQLSESMSKLAEMEAAMEDEAQPCRVRSERWQEERMEDFKASLEYLPTLAQAFGLAGLEEGFGGRRKREVPKKKPIIPLIPAIFSKKKG